MLSRKIVFVLLYFVLCCNKVQGQRLLGVATGIYDPVNSMYLNPASIGECDAKFIVPVFYANASIDNNLGTLSSIPKIIEKTKKYSPNTNPIFNYTGNLQFSMLAPMAEIAGPGIIYAVDDQHTLALTTKVRIYNEFYNFSKLLYNAAIQQLGQVSLNADFKNFKWTADMWSEVGLTYGGVIADKQKYEVKFGVTLNLVGGIGYIALNGKNLEINYKTGVDSFAATNANIDITTSLYGSDNSVSASQILKNMYGAGGRGFGGNVGLMYIAKKDDNTSQATAVNTSHNYKYVLSLSITDIGSITYNNMFTTNITGGGYLSSSGLGVNAKNINKLDSYLAVRGYTRADSVKTEQVYLPTAVLGSIDNHIFGNMYTNALFIVNVANDYNLGNRIFSQFTFTPRYDTKKFSIGMPVTYNTLANDLRIGFGARFGAFFMGSDDILLLVMSHQYGFNFYCGGAIVIHKKKPDDEY